MTLTRLAFALLVVACHWAGATAYRSLTAAETLLTAESVVVAAVLDIEAQADGDLVWTLVRFEVEMTVEASEDDPDPEEEEARQSEELELELRFLGGSLPSGAALLVAGMPTFSVGERVILALQEGSGLASPLVGFEQGLWRLADDGAVDASGRYLGLVRAAGATDGVDRGASGSDAQLTLARSDVPTGVAELLAAIARLRAGDTSLARPSAEDPAVGPSQEEDGEAEGGELITQQIGRYLVDELGGPLLLGDEVAAAAAAWTALAPELIRFVDDPDATALFAYGAPDLFDGETFALTLVDGGNSRSLISPAAGDMLAAALRHELGLVLGLPETAGSGPLPRALSGPDHTPGDAELTALIALASAVQGDLDGDGRVDLYDLLAFAARFGRTGLNDPADLDRDGVVGEADLELLRSLYEFQPPGSTD